MNWWTMIPRDPLMVRDGRPFGTDSSAHTMDFPLPSVVAGTLRTRIGFAIGGGQFGLTVDEARAIEVGAPLLVRLHGDTASAMLPAPADCLYFEAAGDNRRVARYALTPAESPSGVLSARTGMAPYHSGLPTAKPDRDAPRWWNLDAFERWLHAPSDGLMDRSAGMVGLLRETRVHVALQQAKRTAEEGKLFVTEGLRFTREVTGAPEQLAVAVDCNHRELRPGSVTLGGERRLSSLQPLGALQLPKAAPPARRMRVVLLSPAVFAEGSTPKTIEGAEVRCAAVGRALVMSGWDLHARGPKPVRRLAPAGSVYWVEVPATVDPKDWVARVHLRCVSTNEQDRRDGFGMAAVGAWREHA